MKKKKIRWNTTNKNGFTLIELLAVIIILGILMIIAIPSVTKYISDSRKNAYIDTAKEIVAGTRNIVNDGKLGMFDTNTTYYIPVSYIKTENASKSPYGDFTEAYVGVTYDGKGYNYYWISVDDAGQGISKLTALDKLDIDDIESDLKDSDITDVIETTGIGNRSKILILNPESETWNEVVGGATNHVSEEDGESGSSGTGSETIPSNIVCIPATVLHTAMCNQGYEYGCDASGQVGNGNVVTYGTLVNGNPKAGDAYDCKVTSTGGYTERFYYLGSSGDNSILIYYKNMNNQTSYAYDSSNQNWHGPRTAYQYLPSTTEWNNPGLIAPGTRQIVTQNGTGSTSGGTIESFTYTNKAARFLTYQEVTSICGNSGVNTSGYLNNYTWLLEKIGKYEDESGLYGYWIENPNSSNETFGWYISGSSRNIYSNINVNNAGSVGVRPVITIKTSDLG